MNKYYLQFIHKKVLELQGAKKDKKEYKKHSKRPISTWKALIFGGVDKQNLCVIMRSYFKIKKDILQRIKQKFSP